MYLGMDVGTSGVKAVLVNEAAAIVATATCELAVHAFCHALGGLRHQMGVMLSAGASLAWLARILGTPDAKLLLPLGKVVDRSSPVRFLPYLDGERRPHNDAAAAGALVGLRSATGCQHIVHLVGGGSRSALWAQIIADVRGIPVHRVEQGDFGAALGAARLGKLAATGAKPADVCGRPRRLATFAPRASAVTAYDDGYAQWRELYPALKEFSL